MLKRNLITIAIMTLGLGFTSAFGQAADWEIKPAVKKPKTTIKKPSATSRTKRPASVSGSVKDSWGVGVKSRNSGGTISNQRTSGKTNKPKPFFFPNGQGDGTTEQIRTNSVKWKTTAKSK